MPDDLRIPDSVDMQRLASMQLVAKMKESADKYGVGFIGGFIAPNGEKFMMSNMSDEDTQMLLPEDLKWLIIQSRHLLNCLNTGRVNILITVKMLISFWFKLIKQVRTKN